MDLSWVAVIRGGCFLGLMGLFLYLELRASYRTPSQPKARRWAVNLGITGLNSLVLVWGLGALPLLVAARASLGGGGFLPHIPAPYWVRFIIAVLFLDFMLYVWHLLNHVVPLLWRFHRVHHTDLNMDVSTATRFHLGELAVSRVILAGLVYVSGADLAMLVTFEVLVVATAQFHHSSLDVPAWLEAVLWPAMVPPAMHRIHHSVKIRERNSNYGTITSLWDRALGTLVREVDQDRIIIGVGGHFNAARLGFLRLLVQPFTRYVR